MKQESSNTAVINKGLHVPTNNVLFITEVDKSMRGLACNCICFACGEKLVAALGDNNIDYFRHYRETACKGGQETALHQAAKEILVEKSFINTRRFGIISFINGIAERELVSKRPDVTALFEEKPIYFEVAVTHFIEPGKRDFFIEGKHRSIEIDLSKISPAALRPVIENAVLNEISNKEIVYWDPKIQKQVPKPKESKVHPLAIVAGAFAVGWLIQQGLNRLFGRNKKRR